MTILMRVMKMATAMAMLMMKTMEMNNVMVVMMTTTLPMGRRRHMWL